MSMRKKLLFRHSGKTRERREDHRSQENNLQVSKYGMKEERIIEIYHRKKIANFGRIKQIQETQFTSVYKPILL
jgi:hypothetical protein